MFDFVPLIFAQNSGAYRQGQAMGNLISAVVFLGVGAFVIYRWMNQPEKKTVVGTVTCPNCKSMEYKPMDYTWWGGILGPKMFHHVQCAHCKTQYNSKTGNSNSTAIAIYLVISMAIGAVLFGLWLTWYLSK